MHSSTPGLMRVTCVVVLTRTWRAVGPSPDPMDANCGCDRIDEHPEYWPEPANGTREDQVDVHGRLCKLPEPYPPDDCEQLDIESEAVN